MREMRCLQGEKTNLSESEVTNRYRDPFTGFVVIVSESRYLLFQQVASK